MPGPGNNKTEGASVLGALTFQSGVKDQQEHTLSGRDRCYEESEADVV